MQREPNNWQVNQVMTRGKKRQREEANELSSEHEDQVAPTNDTGTQEDVVKQMQDEQTLDSIAEQEESEEVEVEQDDKLDLKPMLEDDSRNER